MAEDVGGLRFSVRANVAEIQSDMGKVNAIINNATARMQRSMVAFTKNTAAAGREIFNLRNAAIGLAGGAFVSLIKRAVEYADNIGDTAEQIGITSKSLQELRYAALQSGVATDEFDKAMLQFSKRLGEAQQESNETSKALKRIGIEMDQIRGMKPDEVMKLVADNLHRAGDSMAQASVAADLFTARVGLKMVPVLSQGASGLKRLADEAHRMGLVLSDETLDKADEADKIFNQMGIALKVAGVHAAVAFLPAMRDLRNLFTSSDFQQGVKDFSENLGKIISWIVENKSEVLAITAAFTGFRILSAFGPWGMAAGAALGYFGSKALVSGQTAEQAAERVKALDAELNRLNDQLQSTQEPSQLRLLRSTIAIVEKQLTEAHAALAKFNKEAAGEKPKINVSQTAPAGPFFHDKTIEQIQTLDFQTQKLLGHFDGFAPGFAEAARGLGLFGTTAENTVFTVSKLPEELQALNDAMLDNEAAKVIDGLKTETQKYETELAKLTVLQQQGKISSEQYNEAVMKLRFPSLTQAIADANNLNKQLDQFSTNSLNNTADALTDVITGTKDAKEAFSELAKSIVRDLIAMTVKALIFRTVGGFLFGFSEGGSVGGGGGDFLGSFLGLKDGGPVHALGGGLFRGPGTGTSDSIPAMVSNGEYIVRASQASKHADLLRAINSGEIDRSPAPAAPASHEVLELRGLKPGEFWNDPMIEMLLHRIQRAVNDGKKIKFKRAV